MPSTRASCGLCGEGDKKWELRKNETWSVLEAENKMENGREKETVTLEISKDLNVRKSCWFVFGEAQYRSGPQYVFDFANAMCEWRGRCWSPSCPHHTCYLSSVMQPVFILANTLTEVWAWNSLFPEEIDTFAPSKATFCLILSWARTVDLDCLCKGIWLMRRWWEGQNSSVRPTVSLNVIPFAMYKQASVRIWNKW